MKAPQGSASFERGLSLNLISVILNAAALTISKFALSNVSPVMTTLIICTTSAALSFIYMIVRHHTATAKEFKRLIPIASINAAATILLYMSIAILDPVVVGMIGRFYVVFTTLLSVVILKERLSRVETSLIVFAILGTFLFVRADSGVTHLHYFGVAMGLAYTFLFALANLFVKKSVHNTSSVIILFYNNLLASLACVVLLFFQNVTMDTATSLPVHTLFFAGLTSLITFLGLLLFFNSFRFLSFKLSNLIRSTSPLFVALVSWPFYPIKLGLANASGGIMVLVSIVLLSIIEKKKG